MELEYKWKLHKGHNLDSLKEVIEKDLKEKELNPSLMHYTMESAYYDTVDRDFEKNRGALRLRRENSSTVICIKFPLKKDNYDLRREFEIEAPTVKEGLDKLILMGAPKEICEKARSSELVELCQVNYERDEYTLNISTDTIGKLALDKGFFIKENKKEYFEEIELEFQCGDMDKFHDFAKTFKNGYKLEQEKQSKFIRAYNL